MKVVIIGYGSIGRRHAKIINKNFKNIKIYICSKQIVPKFKFFHKLSNIKFIKPDYVIIASETSKHLKQLQYLEKNFKNLKILVEKPLFHKITNFRIKKNKVFVGYNLRFHPYILKMQKILKNKKVFDVQLITNSFLPNWRKNISYKNNYASHKSKGGGIILDLSHELDLMNLMFANIKITHSLFGKKSELTKNTEDFLKIIATSKKTHISLDLKYYSRNEIRVILIDSEKFSIFINLKKNIFRLTNDKKISEIKKKYSKDFTYLEMHKAIIYNNKQNILCSYNEGLKVIKTIHDIKKVI